MTKDTPVSDNTMQRHISVSCHQRRDVNLVRSQTGNKGPDSLTALSVRHAKWPSLDKASSKLSLTCQTQSITRIVFRCTNTYASIFASTHVHTSTHACTHTIMHPSMHLYI